MKTLATLPAIALGASLSAQVAQPPSHSGGMVSDGVSYIACDDFQFTNATRLYGVTWWGQTNKAAGAPQFSIAILSEFLGQPGPVELYLAAVPVMNPTGTNFSSDQPEVRYQVYFPTSFVAQANGRYWIEVNGGGRNWAWEGSSSGGQNAMRRDLSNVANPWVQMSANLAFSLQLTPGPADLAIQRDWKLRLHGSVGGSYGVEWADALPPTNWITLTNIILSSSPHFIDLTETNQAKRFYRAVSIP
jgi:hypothetical protein